VKVLDKVSNAKVCFTRGVASVKAAKREKRKLVKKWRKAVVKIKKAVTAMVPLGTHPFKSLKTARCAIFRGRKSCANRVVVMSPHAVASFKRAKKIESKAKEESHTWIIKAMEAEWSQKVNYELSLALQTRCLCSKKRQRDIIWKRMKKVSITQRKMHSKCKMMKCVLKGASATSSECKDNFKPLKKPILVSKAEKVTTKVCLDATKHVKIKSPNRKQLLSMLERVVFKYYKKKNKGKSKRWLARLNAKLDKKLRKYVMVRDRKPKCHTKCSYHTKCHTSKCSVTVYKHCDYRGYGVNLKPGSYDLKALMRRGVKNDDLSSIKIHGPCVAHLYQHSGFGGKVLNKKKNDSCFTNDHMIPTSELAQIVIEDTEETKLAKTGTLVQRSSFNDQISSIRVSANTHRRCYKSKSCKRVCSSSRSSSRYIRARLEKKTYRL